MYGGFIGRILSGSLYVDSRATLLLILKLNHQDWKNFAVAAAGRKRLTLAMLARGGITALACMLHHSAGLNSCTQSRNTRVKSKALAELSDPREDIINL